MKEQIEEIARVLNECCNRYDENGNHLGNKCSQCEYWDNTNHLCCSYNTKEATALYNAGYRKQSENMVEVVRCKDCKWWEAWITGSTVGRCENPRNGLVNEYSEETDFCSYGERKV